MKQLELDFGMISTMTNYVYTPQPALGNITISTSNTGYNGSWITSNSAAATGSYTWANPTPNNTLEVKGENADVVINGKSLVKFMEAMEQRLAILQPDLEKLEHFAALKKAYDHYKALEALCELPSKEDDNS